MSKLDILVAEKVMGWHQEWQPVPMMDMPGRPVGITWWRGEMNWPRYAEIKQTTDSMCNIVPDGNLLLASPWKPSTDLNDALLCLERAANDRSWQIGKWTNKPCTVNHWCEIHGLDGAYGPTAPIAICKAALRSVGVPESLITQAME